MILDRNFVSWSIRNESVLLHHLSFWMEKKNDESEVLGTKFRDMLCYDFSTTHHNSSYHIIPIVGSLSVI